MMRAWLVLVLVGVQDPQADLLGRAASIAGRAGDLDPGVRAEAREEASDLWREASPALGALARGREPAAMLLAALSGNPGTVSSPGDFPRRLRPAAGHLWCPTPPQVPEALRLTEAKELELRIAACLALGRVEDPAARRTIESALGQGMRRTGGRDLVYALVRSVWTGSGDPRPFLAGEMEAERASFALAALSNLPRLALTESASPALLRMLENAQIDRGLRSLLIRSVGRRCPSAFCALLPVRDRILRSEVVDLLDRTLSDPLDAPAVFQAWREAERTNLEDGKDPPQPLAGQLEKWMRRLSGQAAGPDGFSRWLEGDYRRGVDRRADAAVRRGTEGLRRLLVSEALLRTVPGGRRAALALGAYCALKCGLPAEDPPVARALESLLDGDPENTYTASLAGLALGAALERGVPGPERFERRARRMAEILADSQLKSGGWSYVLRAGPDQTVEGWSQDLSNTQFALLGLRALANAGARIPRATWERALELLERSQAPDGGWPYQDPEAPSTASMTAAGAHSWILCRISLDETLTPAAAARLGPAERALGWLAGAAPARTSPPDYYLLYSLERLCVVSGLGTLGRRDWYAEGASLLIRSQSPDGLWSGRYAPLVDTCLALLFLRRVSVARPEVATGGARGDPSDEEVRRVCERRRPSLFVEGVHDVRPGRDVRGGFILIEVDRDARIPAVRQAVGAQLEGIPIRVVAP